MSSRRPPRLLHPAAWWAWAIGVALAASRTTNPILLILLTAVVAFVVAARRQQSPWSRSFGVFLRIGLVAIAVRVLLFAVLAPASGAHVLFRLPEVPLPHWLAGLRLGGPGAAEGLLASAYDGMRLAVILLCVGAANSLTSPRRLLKALPAALYETGVALTVAVAFIPQAVATFGRIRDARRLRGHRATGPASIRSISLAVLEGALERSVDLAAAMDARGFGRTSGDRNLRRVTGLLTAAGLVGVCVGCYGLLDASSPSALGVPVLVLGIALAAVGLLVGGRRATRSRYRPDPRSGPEWLTAVSGLVPATVALAVTSAAALQPSVRELPPLPLLTTCSVLVALLPAWLTPEPPSGRARRQQPHSGDTGSEPSLEHAA